MNKINKSLFSFILVFSMFIVGLLMVSQPIKAEDGKTFYENFSDPNLAEYMAGNLSCNPNDIITQENINSCGGLYIYDEKNISDLTGIETFNQIEYIYVYSNKIDVIPEAIDQLPLKYLTIVQANLTSLPNSLGNISTLKSLDLQNNNLTLLPESFKNLNNLEVLYLTNNPLTALPDFGENQNKLNLIEAGSCKITEVSESIGNATGLKYLNLKQNNLTEFSEAISRVRGLSSLDISENKLSYIPNTITALSELSWLNLNDNQLTALPENIGDLSLYYAGFTNNLIERLPASIGNLTLLSELDLGNNKLRSLPDEITNLRELSSLNVSNNELLTLPSQLNQMTGIHTLNVSGNRQLELPTSLKEMPNLQYLSIGSMGYREIPEIVKQMNKLSSINLDGNEFVEFPLALNSIDFPQLWEVSMNGNKIKSLNNITGNNYFRISLSGNQLIDRIPENVYVYNSSNQEVTLDSIDIFKDHISDPVVYNIFDYLPSILEAYYEYRGNSFEECKWIITKPNGESVELEGNVTEQFGKLISNDYGKYIITLKTPINEVVPTRTDLNRTIYPSFLGDSTYAFPINIMGTHSSIMGTVKDKTSLIPITDAVVGLWKDNQKIEEKQVDGFGAYSFMELEAGNYRVTANAPTYTGKEGEVSLGQREELTYDFLLDKEAKPVTPIIDNGTDKGSVDGAILPKTGGYTLIFGSMLIILIGLIITRKISCK